MRWTVLVDNRIDNPVLETKKTYSCREEEMWKSQLRSGHPSHIRGYSRD